MKSRDNWSMVYSQLGSLSYSCWYFLLCLFMLVAPDTSEAYGARESIKKVYVEGKIIDEQDSPVIGATVIIQGTTIGTASDIDGKFALWVPSTQSKLLVSFIGYKQQVVAIPEKKSELLVKLEQDYNRLEEVVAVGYGTTKAKDLTGAVTRIGSEEIKKAPMVSSIQSMMQGRASGVNVMVGSASPTSPVSVIIRGASSLSGDSQPLWVIDGVPSYDAGTSGDISNTLYNLNLTDVENIDILKDASATAIYGSRAANGVVIVTTKRGQKGMKPQLEFSARYGVQNINSNGFRVLSAEEYIAFSKAACAMSLYTRGGLDYFTKKYIDEAYFNEHTNHSQFDLATLTDEYFKENAYYDGDTDWWKLMTQNSTVQEYSLGLRGGSKESAYNVSIYYKDHEGIVRGGSSQLIGGTMNFDASIRDIVRMKLNIKATARNAQDKDHMIESILKMRPDLPAYTEDGEINMIDYYTTNPLFTLLNTNEANGRNLSATLGLEWDVMKGLTLRSTGTVNYGIEKYNDYQRASYASDKSSASISKNESYTYVWDNTLTHLLTSKNHQLVSLLGSSLEMYESDVLSAAGTGFPDDEVLTDLSSAATKDRIASGYASNTLASFFARVEYKLLGRYLLAANFRMDGSSKFGPSKRWGYFPSAAAAWIISDESFLKENNLISYLKLRGSIGKTGSQNLGNYTWRSLFKSSNYDNKPGIVPHSLGNDILQWESQTQKELGVDFGFFNDRLRGTLGVYEKKVENLLYDDPVPNSSSFTNVTQNIGSLQNRGVEFDFKFDLIDINQFQWNVDFNIATNKTKLLRLNSVDKYFGGGTRQHFKIEEGGETGVFYGYKWSGRLFLTNEELVALKQVNPETGELEYYRDDRHYERQGDLYIMDLDGDGQITAEDDRTELGNANPDFFGGFGTTVYWKGFMLNTVFSYSYGADRLWMEEMENAGDMNVYNTSQAILDSWTMNPGVNTSYPRAMYYGWGENDIITDRYIHDASYLRLSALNISYRFPKTLFGKSMIDVIDLSFQASNLFTWTKYPGMDPQGNFSTYNVALYGMGLDYSTYPSAKTYNIGLKITLK